MKRLPKMARALGACVPLIVVGLPVLYLLAMGPVVFLHESGWISDETVYWLATPWDWAADREWLKPTGVWEPLAAYIRWWVELAHQFY